MSEERLLNPEREATIRRWIADGAAAIGVCALMEEVDFLRAAAAMSGGASRAVIKRFQTTFRPCAEPEKCAEEAAEVRCIQCQADAALATLDEPKEPTDGEEAQEA